MIVASIHTQTVIHIIMTRPTKIAAIREIHDTYGLTLVKSRNLVDAAITQLMALDYAVNLTIDTH